MLDIAPRIVALVKAGWDADMCDTYVEHMEALVHELAHNVILGDLTPKLLSDTSRLIREKTPRDRRDLDEILTTAVTIQVLETYYGTREGTGVALDSVAGNLKDACLGDVSQDRVIELINTPHVMDLAAQLFHYIESLVG
jgi:hypothetical protein